MADPVEMLIGEHKKLRDVFQRFEGQWDRDAREAVAHNAIVELQAHTLIEEEVIYPNLRRLIHHEHLVDRAEEQHRHASDLMEEILDMQPDDRNYSVRFQELSSIMRAHIEEEERELLPELGSLSTEELSHLAGKMTQRRAEFLQDFQEQAVEIGAAVAGAASHERADEVGNHPTGHAGAGRPQRRRPREPGR